MKHVVGNGGEIIMKEKIKKIIPNSWIKRYREVRGHSRVRKEYREDARKYNISSNFHSVGSSPKGVQELLIFHSHALEKGLSHPKFRYNFGRNALIGLGANLDEFKKLNLDTETFAYQNAMSVLKFYKKKHEDQGVRTPLFDSLFSGSSISRGNNKSGAVEHFNQETNDMNFPDLEKFRTSQREFLSSEVDQSLLTEAVALASKTPSVCNRQPWKVYMIRNKKKISKLLYLQNGFNGYDTPPALCVITVDRRAFIGSYERNEVYIDGGLFLMNFDFALTYVGLASCILNTMLPNEKQEKVKSILKISSSEVLIAFVATGYAKSSVMVAKSARKPVKDILKVVE